MSNHATGAAGSATTTPGHETPPAHHKPHAHQTPPTHQRPSGRLPLPALLALATAVFVTSLTETLPAGVLPGMSADLGVGEAAAGQTVTVYALGTALTAVPLAARTADWRRKRLLLTSVAGFAAANTVTAVSSSYALTMGARFLAGVAAGLAWALLAGYARRLAPPHLQGRAVAVAMTGIPLALSLGVPAGTFLGDAVGWRAAFTAMTLIAAGLLGWIALAVPDLPGERSGGRAPVARTLKVPGVLPVLAVTFGLVLAHTVLYTYVAAYLGHLGLGGSTGLVLLVFGVASLAGIGITGRHIDRRLRALTLGGTALVAVGAAALAVPAGSTVLVLVAAGLWGLGWGGAPTLLQTAVADAGGDAADTAQTMLVSLWNAAMAAGGLAGGLLLDGLGAGALPWGVLLLLAPVVAVVTGARAHGFPAQRGPA
ncbi:Major facilitator family transporter [Streptomyces venezuelae]|uniref:MFS transporter n=1 Tax=Streptomyces gardneri TaxID=66892 RepID=UPI0006BD4ABC|nr:MFS transporter [Streptomyces gardneri]ALO06303.1 Major facilitator family transporter [Streptomyces venezuelae]QPK43760.1 MFS transporter [Streptomyces gardneri]WRK35015.1 MFS transporter [Streptomyces venezuelae]CUM43442.1 Major facilitator family transporter [Streptomyces venezuelae]